MPSVPSEFAATFDVESLIALVAGEGQAWVLRADGDRAALSRIDHTGRSTDVVRLPGQEFAMAAYGDGVVVTRRACAAEECEARAVKVLVVDAAGATVAEDEFAREFGGLEIVGQGSGIELIGVQEDVVWVDTGGQLIGYDVTTGGTTVAEADEPGGLVCVLADGLYTLAVVDEAYLAGEILIPAEGPGPVFDVEIRRLVDGVWAPVPDTRRGLTYDEIYWQACTGGGVQAGGGTAPGPVWSASSGWVERGPYLRYPDLATAPEPTARGSAGQLFVLESAGSVRRWFAGPDGPMSSQVLEVPADLFVQLYEPQVQLTFDASDTVVTGCVQRQQDQQSARCWLGSR
ncbi:hypothetical protein [Blastococcus sp. URHD0036]|uniref:hypothetical protein n=1 Tax=Blastococcus sp. URHD0036 TaxID=1380356 RepID=UPI000A5839BE|nr:hypothetical protein [Blastococcus sp. URHD0036]